MRLLLSRNSWGIGSHEATVLEAGIEFERQQTTVKLKLATNLSLVTKEDIALVTSLLRESMRFRDQLSFSAYSLYSTSDGTISETLSVQFEMPQEWEHVQIERFIQEGIAQWFQKWDQAKKAH